MEAEVHRAADWERRQRRATILGELAARHALALIVLGGAAVRFGTPASQSFWYDEHSTILMITLRPSAILQGLLTSETSPPLYFLVAWAWKAVFGLGEVG